MAVTRLENIISSKTGRILYVNPDDFDASDSINNRGNSPVRPFKTIQRALLEVARFSYVPGDAGSNDRFDQFTIMLYPGDHVIDNRPGLGSSQVNSTNFPILDDSLIYDIQSPLNVLHRFNSTRGGVIVPRGTSIVGMDLRKTKILPKFIPDPEQTNGNTIKSNYPSTGTTNSGTTVIDDDTRSTIFRITGACYFWQFSIFDGDPEGVYKFNPRNYTGNPAKLINNSFFFSRHKLSGFEYACDFDLNLYYQKVTRAFGFPTVSDDSLAKRNEETTIVGPGGPTADIIKIASVTTSGTGSSTVAVARTVNSNGTPRAHGFSKDNQVRIFGVTPNNYNVISKIIKVDASAGSGTTIDRFYYTLTSGTEQAGSGNNMSCALEVDTVDSASPYIFNISLRSTYGLCGMHANGAFTSGFKSMVVAQFTGISLQKDENAFENANSAITKSQNINSKYKPSYENYHIKASNDGYIQVVSTFAIGYATQFVSESGGDMSISNSNSTFGAYSLVSRGFRSSAYTNDSQGQITHILPPKSLDTTPKKVFYLPLDLSKIRNSSASDKLYLFGYTSLNNKPPTKILNYTFGAKINDQISVDFITSTGTGISTITDNINPSGSGVGAGTTTPIQYDSNGWFIKVNTTNIKSYINNNFSTSVTGPSPISYVTRIADNRSLNDKIYRLRYVIPSTSFGVAKPPQTGYVIQPRNANQYTNIFYIFNVETYQELTASQNGIYYLTVLRGDISPENGSFTTKKFSQNVNYLYPFIDIDNPVSDPVASESTASEDNIGVVNIDNIANSLTKEAINSWKTNASVGAGLTHKPGNTEDSTRLISVGTGRSVELRKPSTIRAGNHTFEYTGFGPGNYSTSFPSRQTKNLSDAEILISQSLSEAGGLSFYSGLNSNGDLYIGNIVIDPVTGTSKTVNDPTSSTEDNAPIFDNINIKNTLNVLGGENNTLTSTFYGPLYVSKNLTLDGSLQLNNTYSASNSVNGARFNVNTSTGATGSIFSISVNNIPRISVDVDGNIQLDGNLSGTGLSSPSLTSGIRRLFSVTGTGLSYNSSNGLFTYTSPTLQTVTDASSTTSRLIRITNPTDSTSASTGALIVSGGIGVGTSLSVGGRVRVLSNIASTSSTTGALVVTGGVGVGASLNVGGNISFNGDIYTDTGYNDTIFTIRNNDNNGNIQLQTKLNNSVSTRLTIGSTSVTAGAGVSFIGNGTIPVGGIIMWSGQVSNIPSGWALCNGSNGTPDLRNRFIVGAGVNNGSGNYSWSKTTGVATGFYGVGNTGGSVGVGLTIGEMPSHSHTVVAANSTSSGTQYTDHSGTDTPEYLNTITSSSAGGDLYHENRPPYYALAFIMRIA